MRSYYKLDNEATKFHYNDIDELRFNQWIIRKENFQRLNKTDVLDKGCFRMTERVISSDLEITTRKVRNLIKKFENLGIIKCLKKSTSKKNASIYAYVAVYEESVAVSEAVSVADKASNSNDFTDECEAVSVAVSVASKKEDIKRINKKYSDTSNEVQISKYLYDLILKNYPKAKKPNFQTWATVVDRMIRLDDRSVEDIYKVIDFAQHDNFWCTNIMSTEKLRKHFDRLYAEANKKALAGTRAKENTYRNSICGKEEFYSKFEGEFL